MCKNWLRIADWAYATIFAINAKHQIQDQFGFLIKNYMGQIYCFYIISKQACLAKCGVSSDFASKINGSLIIAIL